jgi:homoserine kinase
MHQAGRLAVTDGAADALAAGTAAGAWCGWLSGSGPTVAFLAAVEFVDAIVSALPDGGRARVVDIDTAGAHLLD